MNHYFQKNNDSGRLGSKGFYVALGVCLIAIGVAAWTTYDSVINYASPQENTQSNQPAQRANDTVSGVFVSPQSREAESAAEETPSIAESKPVASEEPAKQTAAEPLKFSYPVGSAVAKKFSGENPVFSDTMKDWRAHDGVDFVAKEGDEVKAVANGTVKDVYQNDLYGNIICVEHGDISAYYCGLQSMNVKKGETVASGQKLGTVGTVPCENADAAHFHFSMKKNSKAIDPLSVLK